MIIRFVHIAANYVDDTFKVRVVRTVLLEWWLLVLDVLDGHALRVTTWQFLLTFQVEVARTAICIQLLNELTVKEHKLTVVFALFRAAMWW